MCNRIKLIKSVIIYFACVGIYRYNSKTLDDPKRKKRRRVSHPHFCMKKNLYYYLVCFFMCVQHIKIWRGHKTMQWCRQIARKLLAGKSNWCEEEFHCGCRKHSKFPLDQSDGLSSSSSSRCESDWFNPGARLSGALLLLPQKTAVRTSSSESFAVVTIVTVVVVVLGVAEI